MSVLGDVCDKGTRVMYGRTAKFTLDASSSFIHNYTGTPRANSSAPSTVKACRAITT
jgi:hypothetical protein